MISRIIQTEVNVFCRREAEANNIDRSLNNSLYHVKAETNNCLIIHLKTSETYRALLGSSCWPRRGLSPIYFNNLFFWIGVRSKKINTAVKRNAHVRNLRTSAGKIKQIVYKGVRTKQKHKK